eukprot:1162147-Pelagomonas_calceolata.AAC.17
MSRDLSVRPVGQNREMHNAWIRAAQERGWSGFFLGYIVKQQQEQGAAACMDGWQEGLQGLKKVGPYDQHRSDSAAPYFTSSLSKQYLSAPGLVYYLCIRRFLATSTMLEQIFGHKVMFGGRIHLGSHSLHWQVAGA